MQKALIIPINTKQEILIQDRRNYKKPDWGLFGGSIEEGETPLEAVIREAKEELSLELTEEDLVFLGILYRTDDEQTERYMYLYRTGQEFFEDLEAGGAHWFSFEKARSKLEIEERFDDLINMINAETSNVSD